MSYDPNPYYKEDSLLFSVPSQRIGLDALLEQFCKYNSIGPGNRNKSVFMLGLKANEQGFSEYETAAFCVAKLGAPDFDETEIRATIASAFKGNRTFLSSQIMPPESQTTANTATLQYMRNLEGVEERSDVEKLTDFYDLINNTPFIESFVYDNLPMRLDRAIRHCKNKRLSDVMLLSTMVALSACLPKVTVKRHGLITLRLAMNLAALRKAEDKKSVDHYLLRDGL